MHFHEELASNAIRCLISTRSQIMELLASTQQNLQSTMSHMIRTGLYEISNYMYTNRYVYMSEENKLGFGREFGQSIQVEVLNNIQHLATLYDTATQLYLGCDVDEGKVKGYTDPQVLQLSSEDGIKFESLLGQLLPRRRYTGSSNW
ncbi:hypothetical protein BDR03DRAFT_163029 [Suillus americanus]|nr:hypothetical protein BDR03DRAFT_163029 [Suillus americanus]